MAITAGEVIKWKARMCLNGCDDCEILKEAHKSGIKGNFACERFCAQNPGLALQAVDEYKKQHGKTLAQDFFEKYPNAPARGSLIPTVCPYQCGYEDKCPKQKIGVMVYDCEQCWYRLLEDV